MQPTVWNWQTTSWLSGPHSQTPILAHTYIALCIEQATYSIKVSPYDVKIHTRTQLSTICVNLPKLITSILWLLPNEQQRSECLFCSLLWLFDITYSVGWLFQFISLNRLTKCILLLKQNFQVAQIFRWLQKRNSPHIPIQLSFSFSSQLFRWHEIIINEYEFRRSESNKNSNIKWCIAISFLCTKPRIFFSQPFDDARFSDETST